MKPEPHMKVEDEEDLLYGESGNAFKVTSVIKKSHIRFIKNILAPLPFVHYRLSTWQFRRRIKIPIGGDAYCNRSNQRIGSLSHGTMAIWRYSLCPT